MAEDNKEKALDAVRESVPSDVRPIVYALLYIGDMISKANSRGE
jgi:hypothetical protein